MKPTITIITVVKNAKQTIKCALESVAKQRYPYIEHLILDGDSSDGTKEIIRAFAKSHSNISFSSKPDKGMYHALNEGISKARGDIIGFLHADDFFKDDSVLAKVAQSSLGVDAVYGDLVYVEPNEPNKVRRYWQAGAYKPKAFAKGWHPPHTALFIKKAVYKKFGGFDTDLPIGNDVELMMRYFEKHHIKSHYIPHIFVCMRLGGISNRSFKNIFLQNKTIMQSFAQNDLRVSWPYFIFHKSIDRLKQFTKRPKELEDVS